MQGVRTAAQFVANFKRNGKVNRLMLTGAAGQLTTELYPYLKQIYGEENILATDLKNSVYPENHFKTLDVTDKPLCEKLINDFKPDTIIHSAAILSAASEQNPELSLRVNNIGAKNFLDICSERQIRLLVPSSIASFGPSTPKRAPNLTIQRPESIYGITKVLLELLGNYYYKNHNLDFRALRYAVVTSAAPASSGAAACTAQIYHAALQSKKYEMYLKPETRLPVIYTDDVITGTLGLLEADNSRLTDRSYNLTSTSFSIGELVESVKKAVPGFEVVYNISEYRQRVADSWIDDVEVDLAKQDFDYQPQFTLEAMTEDVLTKIREHLAKQGS